MSFSIKFKAGELKKAVANVQREINNNKKVLKQVGEAEVVATRRRIRATKAAPDGRRWAPWKPSTSRSRRKAGTAGRGLLFSSGALSRSFKIKVSRNSLSIRSDVPYAKYLQNGTTDMAARPFMGWAKKSKTILKMEFGKRIKKAWK